ncbi:MAG: hypothetical protein XD38_0328, partial [Pseudomonas sp. 63_8]
PQPLPFRPCLTLHLPLTAQPQAAEED